MPLAQLPPGTVKLISSSQVITSVSSVVKELMENSIDSGAEHIEIKLDKHGLEKIEVKDDGCGIGKSDVTVMCLPSYTSKISDFSDLDSLSSYGFRGEALSALCNVSHVSVTTKTAQDDVATCYTFDHNGQVTCSKTSHIVKGSIVSVTELFKNLPVRKQFMSNSKKAGEELKNVEKLVKSLAVVHPRLRVTLAHNKFLCWQKTSVANLRQSVMQVVSLSMAKQLHHILHNTEQIRVEMLVPKCDCNVSSLCFPSFSDAHFLFINQRPVRNKEVEKVVYDKLFEYFGVYVPVNKYPLCVTCLSVPPDCLDVNLEPNKTRVYLKNQDDVLDIVQQCLHIYYGNNPKEYEEDNTIKPIKKRKIENASLEIDSKEKEISTTNSNEGLERNDLIVESLLSSDLQDNTNEKVWDCAFEKFCLGKELTPEDVTSVKPFNRYLESIGVEKEIKCSNIVSLSSSNCFDFGPIQKNVINGNSNINKNIAETDTRKERNGIENLEKPDGHLVLAGVISVAGTLNKASTEEHYKPRVEPVEEPDERLVNNVVDSDEDDVTMILEHSPSVTDSGKGSQEDSSPTLSQWSRGEVATSSSALVKGSYVLTNNVEALSPQASDRSVTSQMGCKEMSAFTKFARNMRKQIIEENPHISFTRVAQQLQVKWRQLNVDKRKKFEESAPIKKATTPSPAPKQRTLIEMKNVLSKETPKLELDINLSSLKQMVNCTTVEEKDIHLVGRLEASPLWLYRSPGPGSAVSVFSVLRLMEAVNFHQHLANFALPSKLLDSHVPFYLSDIGEAQWSLLVSLERSPNGVVKDLRILNNGLVVEIVDDETEARLTYVPQHISFCGMEELQEVLKLLLTHGPEASLDQCRPLRVISFLRSEVMRECSLQEPPTEHSQVSILLSYWQCHVTPHTQNCIHHLPVTLLLSST